MKSIFPFESLAYCQPAFVFYLVPAAPVIGDWDSVFKFFMFIPVMYVYIFPRRLIVGVIAINELLSK
jgi:hypothetical protein